ncbi:hypothetical protein GCM10010121_071690 [Streptomyces brasiliensis]|uniref:Integrase n=1 Tax=Streptomyces brasiliensis TaxID=1954 RepID=A0A917L908_9ACTN|nr:hypothetical protein GCM10010121_071690 [Streptomyces brasiliensis]
MRPSTLRTLKRAAELTRQNRLTEAVLIAEPVILAADSYEGDEILRCLADLFFSEKGSVVPSSTYYRVWQEARLLALPPAVTASPLASRPYDLRHSALSTWLNAGVDPTDVAERAGNSVEVLLTRYAKCLDGRQEVANRRIEDLLREYE